MWENCCVAILAKKKRKANWSSFKKLSLSSTVLKEHMCNFGNNNSIIGCYLRLAMVSVGSFASCEAHCGEQYTEPLYYQGIYETINNVFSAKSY